MRYAPRSRLEWLTVDEAADYLRVNRTTIYRWAREGKVSLYRVGQKATRLRRQDLDAMAEPIVLGDSQETRSS